MVGFAPNHHANGDEAIITARLSGHCYSARNFQSAGHCQHFIFMSRLIQRRLSACNQHIVQMVVEARLRSEEHPSELQSLMRISYAVFCLKKKHKQLSTQIIKSIAQNGVRLLSMKTQ